ncbi:hypothetical protein DYB36_006091 [Aphanomyces astaci]|uniref:PH domain-containing protein n=1 Tax=Aphanomyces astaci TaxID=112090 RepID=A0A397B3N0_APHAT|nr:hypothetical protein DYB36_006091 [Aphanomyces astaci]
MQKDTSVHEWQGWIQKQGSVVPSWKKRYLVLSGQNISYFDKEVSNPRAKEKGSFVLAGVQPNKSYDNGMTLLSKEGKAMNITTKTVGEYVMCKNALENAVSLPRRRVSNPSPAAAAAGEYRSSSAVRTEQSSVGAASPSPYDNRISNENLRSPPQSSHQQLQPNPYALRSQHSSANDDYQQHQRELQQLQLQQREQHRQQQREAQEQQRGQQELHNRPTYTGWLDKQGEIVQSWKQRYFVLRGRNIAYFDTVDGNQKGGGRLADVTMSDTGLHFHLDNGRVVNVTASSSTDLEGWHNVVSQVLGKRTDITNGSPHEYAGAAEIAASQDKPLSAFLDKYVPADNSPRASFDIGDTGGDAMESMTPDIVADFASKFAMDDLASPPPATAAPIASNNNNGGLWLQKGGSTYVDDPTAERTVLPTREHPISTDVAPPRLPRPLVRNTSTDDVKAKLWVAPPKETPVVQPPPVGVADITPPANKPGGVSLPGMTGGTAGANGGGGKLPQHNDHASPLPVVAAPPPAESGLWIQKGGATYVPDDTAVPTVLPKRSVIDADILPPANKGPIVRTSSSDDLKNKLWVAAPAAATDATALAGKPAVRGMGSASTPVRQQPPTAPAPRGFDSSAVPTIVAPPTPVAVVEHAAEVVVAPKSPVVPPRVIEQVAEVEVARAVASADKVSVASTSGLPPASGDTEKPTPAPKGCCTIM